MKIIIKEEVDMVGEEEDIIEGGVDIIEEEEDIEN